MRQGPRSSPRARAPHQRVWGRWSGPRPPALRGLSPLPLGRFLLLSTLARIPSVVTSTWAGASFASNNLWLTVGIFLCTGLLGLGGIWFQRRYLAKKNRGKAAPGGEG